VDRKHKSKEEDGAMKQETNILDTGLARLREAVGSLEDEAERLQGEFRTRQKDFEKRTEKLRTEIRDSNAVKQLEELRERATRQVEEKLGDLLASLKIASKDDVRRIDRRLRQLNRKLKDLDKSSGRRDAA